MIETTDLTTRPACWPTHPDCPTCQGGGDAGGVDGACPTCGGDGALGMCDDCRVWRDTWCEAHRVYEEAARPGEMADWLLRQVFERPPRG